MIFKKYSPALVCGFGAAVFTILPGLNQAFGCCLSVPIAVGISLILYKKINPSIEKISGENALLFGLFTGLIAAFFSALFDTIMTFFLHTNQFVESIPEVEQLFKNIKGIDILKVVLDIYHQAERDIKTTGFSLFYTISTFVGNIFIFSISGIIGGFISMFLINKRNKPVIK